MFRRDGQTKYVDASGFELVCGTCLATRGLLDSERLPEACPHCGARDPWKGPFARGAGEQVAESPFYLAVSRRPRSSGVASS